MNIKNCFGTKWLTWSGSWKNTFVLLIISTFNHLGYEGVDDSTETFAIINCSNQSIWKSVCLLICFTASKRGQTDLTSVSGNVIKQNAQNLTLTVFHHLDIESSAVVFNWPNVLRLQCRTVSWADCHTGHNFIYWFSGRERGMLFLRYPLAALPEIGKIYCKWLRW